jgi:hypothetical protein
MPQATVNMAFGQNKKPGHEENGLNANIRSDRFGLRHALAFISGSRLRSLSSFVIRESLLDIPRRVSSG